MLIIVILSLTLIIAAAALAAGAGIARIIIRSELMLARRDVYVTLGLIVTAIAGALVLTSIAQQHQGAVAPTTLLVAVLTLAVSATLAVKVRKLGLI